MFLLAHFEKLEAVKFFWKKIKIYSPNDFNFKSTFPFKKVGNSRLNYPKNFKNTKLT